jgi:propionyl-CoA carboxylase beta chain
MNTTKYNDFEEKNRKAELGGGADKIEKQHAAGKMTLVNALTCWLTKILL